MIAFGLRRGTNVHWQPLLIGRAERAALKRQKPAIVWLTACRCGKSTIANLVERQLNVAGYHTTPLDGDNVRHGLNPRSRIYRSDRVENMSDAPVKVAKVDLKLALSFCAPSFRLTTPNADMVRRLVRDGEFIEALWTPELDECMRRDPKGLMPKQGPAASRISPAFYAPYEPPEAPEHLRTAGHEPVQLAELVVKDLGKRGIIGLQ